MGTYCTVQDVWEQIKIDSGEMVDDEIEKRITEADAHSRRIGRLQEEDPAERGLTEHEGLVYRLTRENQPIRTADLWRLYGKRCRTHGLMPAAERTFLKYVKALVDTGLIKSSDRFCRSGGRLLSALGPQQPRVSWPELHSKRNGAFAPALGRRPPGPH